MKGSSTESNVSSRKSFLLPKPPTPPSKSIELEPSTSSASHIPKLNEAIVKPKDLAQPPRPNLNAKPLTFNEPPFPNSKFMQTVPAPNPRFSTPPPQIDLTRPPPIFQQRPAFMNNSSSEPIHRIPTVRIPPPQFQQQRPPFQEPIPGQFIPFNRPPIRQPMPPNFNALPPFPQQNFRHFPPQPDNIVFRTMMNAIGPFDGPPPDYRPYYPPQRRP